MKYLLLNSLKCGGAERVAQTLCNSNLFDGVILLEKDQDFDVFIPVYRISKHTNKTNSFFKTLYIPFYAFKLNKIIKKDDIVVSFLERSNFVNIFLSFFKKHKTIITLHTNISKSFLNKKKFLYFILIKMLYKFADAIVPVSLGIKEDFNKIIKFRKLQKVIFNPIDFDLINREAQDDNFLSLSSRKNIITVGRLSLEKAQWNLIKVFNSLQKNIQSRLIIIGDGPLKGSLIDYAKYLGLRVYSVFENQKISDDFDIYFMGYQLNPYKFIKKGDIFMLSSVFEGLPTVILESMACGVPVISSDCDFGPREILKKDGKDYGVLLPVLNSNFTFTDTELSTDEQIWADTTLSFLKDQNKRDFYSNLSKERAQDFSIEKIIIQWEDLFKKT